MRGRLRFRTWEVFKIVTVVLTGIGSAPVLYLASRRVISGGLSDGSLWI